MIPVLDEGLIFYFDQIGKYPLLSQEQEAKADRETLVTSNLRLAVSIAKSYARNIDDFLENIQNANVGLCKAADKFDPARGRFAICAIYYIKSEIKNRRTDSFGNLLNKRKYEPIVQAYEDLTILNLSSTDDPEESTYQNAMLKAACQIVSEKQREVLMGRIRGKTYKELALETNSTYQNIQQLEKKALKRIAEL